MPSRIPIAYIDIRVFVHSTENIDKVLNAVRNTLPAELFDMILFKKTNLKGHYRNPIILIESRIKEKDTVGAVFEKLASNLNDMDKELLSSEIKQHLDKGNLYIRLDKQSAYVNELKLCSADPIHVRIHFKKSSSEQIVNICRKLGMLP